MRNSRSGKTWVVVVLIVLLVALGVLCAALLDWRASLEDGDVLDAVREGRTGKLRLMLLLRPQLANASYSSGGSALHKADEYETAKLLLAHGAAVSAINTQTGETSLHRAVVDGSLKLVKLLVEHGADLTARDNDGRTPLHFAGWQRPEIARFLISHGASPGATNAWGGTPLHEAAMFRAEDVAEVLISAGCPVNKDSAKLGTALHIAAEYGRPVVARVLLEAGASVNARRQGGDTPLHLAVRKNNKDVIRLLVEHGARTDVKNDDGETPLDIARARKGNMVRVLGDEAGGQED